MANNLFGLSQVSTDNPLLDRKQMNIGAGLNANGTLKAPAGSLAGNSPVKESGGFGWIGAVIHSHGSPCHQWYCHT